MMKTFDEYIQGRILKAYNNAPGQGICDNFDELARMFRIDSIDNITEYMLRYGCGKGRAKDYANYIVAWLEEQEAKENELELVVCPRCGGDAYKILHCCHSECELNLAGHSHLTDEDSKHIKNLAAEMVNAYSLQHQDNTATKLINFINSLKGE